MEFNDKRLHISDIFQKKHDKSGMSSRKIQTFREYIPEKLKKNKKACVISTQACSLNVLEKHDKQYFQFFV